MQQREKTGVFWIGLLVLVFAFVLLMAGIGALIVFYSFPFYTPSSQDLVLPGYVILGGLCLLAASVYLMRKGLNEKPKSSIIGR